MEEKLREELRQIWLQNSKTERKEKLEAVVHPILEESPQRLLDLCDGHIGGLPDVNLLRKAKDDVEDFVFMNISTGSYYYSTVEKEPPHPDSRAIKKIYRELLRILGLGDKEIQTILNRTSRHEEYNAAPALTLLDILIDANLCAAIDWKFGPDDVEYNFNLIAKRLKIAPIREFPPYEEGQPLGYEAIVQVIRDCDHAAVALFDGDEILVFLTTEESAPKVKAKLEELSEFWDLEDIEVVTG